jgi:hypothetical protein
LVLLHNFLIVSVSDDIPNQPQNGGFRAIAALSMQGWCAGNGYSLVKHHNAAVEALRGSRRAGLKALHAALHVLDWGGPTG